MTDTEKWVHLTLAVPLRAFDNTDDYRDDNRLDRIVEFADRLFPSHDMHAVSAIEDDA